MNSKTARYAFLLAFLLASAGCSREPVPLFPDGDYSFSLVLLPDTQVYAARYPELFTAQTSWIAEHRDELDIRYVIHLGDVTDHNNAVEWDRARKAFALIDGKVPYAIALGNHDFGENGTSDTRQTLFDDYFPLFDFQGWETFGGCYDREESARNCFHVFDAAGKKWLILVLEIAARDDVLRWANGILSQFAERKAIIVTHAYLDARTRRRLERGVSFQHAPPHDMGLARNDKTANDAEGVWQKLVSRHASIRMVVCGHVHKSARQASRGKEGNLVHEMTIDFQGYPRGGDGWLRIIRFSGDGEKAYVRDYSPAKDSASSAPDHSFVIPLD